MQACFAYFLSYSACQVLCQAHLMSSCHSVLHDYAASLCLTCTGSVPCCTPPPGALALRILSSLPASSSERCLLCCRQQHVGFVNPAVVPVGISTEANLQQNVAAEPAPGVEVSPIYKQLIHSFHHSFSCSFILDLSTCLLTHSPTHSLALQSFLLSRILSFFQSVCELPLVRYVQP